MSLLGQLSITAAALTIFYLLVWRRLGWSTDRTIARGSALYDRGDFAGALKLYRSARARQPRSALAWECEGLACVMLEEWHDAAEALGHAIRLQPKPMRQAHTYHALALAREGDHPAATERVTELVETIDATRATADAFILADAARALGGEDRVVEAMTTLLDRHPRLAAAHLARARAEWARGRPRAARRDAIAAHDQHPSAAGLVEVLARLELGEGAEAKRVARRIAESLPPALKARLAREGDTARAVSPEDTEEALQRAFALAEGSDPGAAVRALDEAQALEVDRGRSGLLRAALAFVTGEPVDPEAEPTARELRLLAGAAERKGQTERADRWSRAADEIDP